MTLGDLIRQYREEHGLSQRQFAQICGLSNGYISLLELGYNRRTGKPVSPMLTQFHKLAKGMGMTIDDLIRILGDEVVIDLSASAEEYDESATDSDDGQANPVNSEITSLLSRLSPKKAQEALNYLRYLAEHEE